MDQNEKVANDKISKLENEIKVLKNEVQAVLLDLRESYLNMENPFNTAATPSATQQIVITEHAPVRESRPEPNSKDNPISEKPEKIQSKRSSAAEITKPEIATTREEASPENLLPAHSGIEIASVEPEVKTISIPKPTSQQGSSESVTRRNNKLDLMTMAGLTGWVENSTKRLGRERAEAVVDISQAMGYVSADLKPILIKLISLVPPGSIENATGTRDYIDSLVKLNNLLGKDSQEEAALLLLGLKSGDMNHG
jgi:hypothetical protein